jgi:hypothetical protein
MPRSRASQRREDRREATARGRRFSEADRAINGEMGLVHGSMSSDFEPQRAVPPNEDSEQQRAGPSSHDPGVPVRVGGPRIATQLSTFLPGAHLTLISVLQGVGLAVLAGEVNSAHLELLPNALLYVDSVLLIFLAWFLYVAAFVGSQWPFNALHSALQFGFAAAEVYAFSHVTHPRQWLFGFAAAAIIGGIIRLLNIILLEERMYTVDAHNLLPAGQVGREDWRSHLRYPRRGVHSRRRHMAKSPGDGHRRWHHFGSAGTDACWLRPSLECNHQSAP